MKKIIQNCLFGIMMVGIAGAFFAAPFAFCDLITQKEAISFLLTGGIVSYLASLILKKIN
jgi:hypothetical protein